MSSSSKRKWDDEANSTQAPVSTDAAAQAGEFSVPLRSPHALIGSFPIPAAIAARIAATMSGAAGGAFGSGSPSSAIGATPKDDKKDLYDGAFTHDIDINDLRNRYLITKGSTQQQVSVSLLPCNICRLKQRPSRYRKRQALQ
jgi:hypothetical protein